MATDEMECILASNGMESQGITIMPTETKVSVAVNHMSSDSIVMNIKIHATVRQLIATCSICSCVILVTPVND